MAARATATRGLTRRGDRRAARPDRHRARADRARGRAATPTSFVVGKVLAAEQHPDADRLKVCEVDDGSGRAAHDRLRRAQRRRRPDGGGGAARRRDARRHEARRGQAARRQVERDDPGRGRGRASATTTTGSWCWTTRWPPGAPLADALPIADEVLELEITPNRPDCLSVYGVAREVHAATGAPLAADPTDADAERLGRRRAERPRRASRSPTPTICLRFTARVFEDVKIGPSPAWLQAAADRRRPAPDLQRRRHHQLRDAAHSASRCTPSTSTRCAAARSSCARARRGRR